MGTQVPDRIASAATLLAPWPICSRALENYEFPPLIERLVAEGRFRSREEAHAAFSEFKRWVRLVRNHGGGIPMTSRDVDAVWHEFILFTEEYHSFSAHAVGRYLHHRPASIAPINADSVRRFFDLYRAEYGDIPATWRAAANCNEPPGGCTPGDCSPPCMEGR